MSEIISYHNFLFPFRFDKIVTKIRDKHHFYKDKSFDERVDINDAFKEDLQADGWIYEKFEVKNNLDYNELVYFYDFVKDSLFNTEDFSKNATSYFFTKNVTEDNYTISIKNKDKEDTVYKLKLTSISLRVFDTGVAILSFEVENYDYKKMEDILKINEYGRRIYPQFLIENFELTEVKDKFLANSLRVNGIEENFKRSDYKGVSLASFIVNILGTKTWSENIKDRGKHLIQPLLDDRMFVVCWYGDNKYSNIIKNDINLENDKWYKFVFIDKDKMVQNSAMQKELIVKSTYTRWQDYGTLYGITRYSFVALTDSSDFSKNVLLNHMRTIYFQLIILLLAQRSSIIRFSDEITAISDIDEKNSESSKISNLYKNYLRFKNKLYFKEVTAQEQGIELYDKAREIMRIDSDIKDLSNEIVALNSYAFILEEKDEKEQMNKLTKLGTIFLPPTFIAGIFGMNTFSGLDNIGGFLFSVIIMVCVTYYVTKVNNISIKEFLGLKNEQ